MSSKTKSHSNNDQKSRSNPSKRSENGSNIRNETTPDTNTRANTHHMRLPDPVYNVYLVYFNSIWPRLKFEVGLLIATDERIIRKGHYYEVKGPRPARGYTDRAEYHLYYSIIKSPENSMYFRKIAHIGKMRESKLYLALRIAEQIPPPQVALTYRGESPNCIDWMNNFLFELARFKVIQFDTDFETPKEKRLLTHPSLLTPDELVSVGMSPTLSDRYVPPSKIPASSNKTNHPSSSSPSKPTTTSHTKPLPSSSKKPDISSNTQPKSTNAETSSSKQGNSSKAPTSPQRDKSGTSSKSGKIPSSSSSSSPKQGKDDPKHKHLSFRRFFSKK